MLYSFSITSSDIVRFFPLKSSAWFYIPITVGTEPSIEKSQNIDNSKLLKYRNVEKFSVLPNNLSTDITLKDRYLQKKILELHREKKQNKKDYINRFYKEFHIYIFFNLFVSYFKWKPLSDSGPWAL
jgi:hypothetical protein